MLSIYENGSQKSKLLSEEYPVLYENRYCDLEDFGVVMCGGRDYETDSTFKEVVELTNDNKTITKLPPMLKVRGECKTAVIGSDVYVITVDESCRISTQLKFYQIITGKSCLHYLIRGKTSVCVLLCNKFL